MKLDIKQAVKAGGELLPFDCEINLSGVVLSGEHPFREPVRLSGSARAYSGVLELILNLRFVMEKSCDRCGKNVRREMELCLTHEISLYGETGELDDYPVEDGFLDLSELAAQDIILELPILFLCSVDCSII